MFSPQDTLRHSKGIGTLTKKTKAPQITEEDKVRAAIEVKKNSIKTAVADLWRRLQVILENTAIMFQLHNTCMYCNCLCERYIAF